MSSQEQTEEHFQQNNQPIEGELENCNPPNNITDQENTMQDQMGHLVANLTAILRRDSEIMHEEKVKQGKMSSQEQTEEYFQQNNRPTEDELKNCNPPNNITDQENTMQDQMRHLVANLTAILRRDSEMHEAMKKRRSPNGSDQKNVRSDLPYNIMNFNGLSGSSTARIWLYQLESTALLHRWSEEKSLETARNHLTQAANIWYSANAETFTNWQIFKKAFAKTFMAQKEQFF